jgi:tetratricopeptide (TPR) repeat protein
MKGINLDNLGRYQDAIKSFDQVLLIDPNDKEAHFMKGILLGNQRRYDDAIKSINQVLLIDPNCK